MEILLVNSDDAFFVEEPEEEIVPRQRPTVEKMNVAAERVESYMEYLLKDLDHFARKVAKLRLGWYGMRFSHGDIKKILGTSEQNIRVAEKKLWLKIRDMEDIPTVIKMVSVWSEEVTSIAEEAKIEISNIDAPVS